jgi:hypothetical protein
MILNCLRQRQEVRGIEECPGLSAQGADIVLKINGRFNMIAIFSLMNRNLFIFFVKNPKLGSAGFQPHFALKIFRGCGIPVVIETDKTVFIRFYFLQREYPETLAGQGDERFPFSLE